LGTEEFADENRTDILNISLSKSISELKSILIILNIWF